MKSIKATKRILALILSVMVLAAAVPFAAAAEGGSDFVSENLLRKEGVIDLENSKTSMYQWAHDPDYIVDNARLDGNNVFDKLIDGNLTYAQGEEPDIIAFGQSNREIFGLLYALTDTYYASSIKLYGGANSAVDYYRIYASDDLSTLYQNENVYLVAADGSENGTTVELNRDVKYIALFYDHLTTYERTAREDSTNGRPKEIELWSGNEAERFDSVNLLTSEHYTGGKAVLMDAADSSVADYPNYDYKIEGVINGIADYNHQDFANINGKYVGLQFAFEAPQYVGEVIIDSGTYWDTNIDYDEYFDVYASNTPDDLYSEESKVAENVHCDNQMGARVELNQYATYIAIINKQANGSMRMRQVLVKSADGTGVDVPDIFVSENALQTKLEKAETISLYETGSVAYEDIIANGTIKQMTDGITNAHIDLKATLEYTPPRKAGAQFTLTESLYIGEIKIYAGYETYPETYSVYASDTLETLYSAESKIADSIRATENSIVVANADKNVKYIAFVCESYDGNPRFKEIEAWTADPNEAFVSENLLQTSLAEKATYNMSMESGSVSEGDKFDQNGALEISVDGDTAATKAVYDCIEGWEYPIYPGARYTLNDVAYTEKLTVYSSGKIMAYASDALDTLYAQYNCIADETEVSPTGTDIEIGRDVKYLAVFMVGYADVAEFQLWSGDPSTKPEEPDEPDINSLKVLTIGNSFSENTSIYASEIAKANGKSLTFGYLKFPSCKIEQHYQAAIKDLAVFKFQITDPDSNRTTIKNEAPRFDSPNPDSATIVEALEYTDWDVIVFQQESSSSLVAASFEMLDELIEYVKGSCPDAKLAIHEVWSWGSWTNGEFDTMKANTYEAAKANNLEIIPTGTAFEIARAEIGDYTALNDYDNGDYQHANALGQYVAGACYVATLFGIEVDSAPFISHPDINGHGNVQLLTDAVNEAVAERPIFGRAGDFNEDGYLRAEDLTVMRKALLGAETVGNVNADVNEDSTFDIKDYIRLKKIIAGLA